MSRIILFISLLFMTFSCFGVVIEETGSFQNFLFANEPACEYDRWVSHISEGIAIRDYNLYAPWERQTTGFGTFRVATLNDLSQWNLVINSLMNGSYENAQEILTTYNIPYKVVKFNDTDTGRTYYLLRENLDLSHSDNQGTTDTADDELGSFSYGWGLYVFNPQAASPVIVTVVHPNDDFIAPYIAAKSFVEWDAMFLQIAGAGREVAWTGNYSNSTSISDPSRIEASAFNYAYKIFCDKIRNQFGRREFSFQAHSYDWNRHAGRANTQISAGATSYCLNLPIRDLSNSHEDMIHHGQPIMLQANTIGANREVKFNDYYAFYNRTYLITYENSDTTFGCNTNVDLWGFSGNTQASYTLKDWNDYDVFDPFLHIEMDELPNCYDQTTNNLKWFYGYNTITGKYDLDHVYDRAWTYFAPLIHNITSVLPSLFEMNDNQSPSVPTNLQFVTLNNNYVNLQWERSYAYDFLTYEILYSTLPLNDRNYNLFTRENDVLLASQVTNQISIPGLEDGVQYYFKVRAKDYHGMISSESNMISLTTGPALYFQSPNIINFGPVTVNTISEATTVSITNTGGTEMIISSVEKKGTDKDRFILTDINSYPFSLGTGEVMTFTVAFNPLIPGNCVAEIDISDDITKAIHIIEISGRGYDPSLPVELSSFTAVFANAQLMVTLQWITESETSNLGFNILRSTEPDIESALCLNHLIIPGTNTSTQSTYQFVDHTVEAPNTYYYWLENIDINGYCRFNGPVVIHILEQEDPNIPPVPITLTRLHNAYPNPFNAETNIVFDLKITDYVNITIYDVRGQKIQTLTSKIWTEGTHHLVWDGLNENHKSVSSGVYFYRMIAGKYHTTQKVVLMK